MNLRGQIHRTPQVRLPGFTVPKWFLLVVFLLVSVHVFIDRLYAYRLQEAMGYSSIYVHNMVFELLTRYLAAALGAVLAWWAVRPLRHALPSAGMAWLSGAVALVGWAMGYTLGSLSPTPWYLFFNHVPFSQTDPLFHLNLSFYVYQLPLLVGLVGRIAGMLILLVFVRGFVLLALALRQHVVIAEQDTRALLVTQGGTLLWLLAGLLATFTGLSVLLRYEIALAPGNGSFLFGPGFVESRLTAPVFSWLHIAALIWLTATLVYLALRPHKIFTIKDGLLTFAWRGWRRSGEALGAYVGLSILTAAISGLVNGLYVHPNQSTVELPYIQRTIVATRFALGLNSLHTVPFQPATTVTAQTMAGQQDALDNVRINDQGQTTSVYNQLQSFKSYFNFPRASVDRYGTSEVYVSAREMNVDQLPAQTWINRTLVYTHGYGLVASPVSQVDQDGLPTLWAKDTPQVTQSPLPAITQPDIYFGLMNNNVIAPSKIPEFDYPVGAADETSHYQGGYGLPVQGNRFLLALENQSLQFYTSDQLTSHSLWLFDRNIYTRVAAIAPFLRYDHDAFPFVSTDGHILWMLDAYTQSANIPYAQTVLGTSYIRNSVKVVMDAYTGQVTFYVTDPRDPMIQSLMRVYPGVFTTHIPEDVRAHFRYPKDLFAAQAQALTRYHMTNPVAFYNQEDLWALANQIYQQNRTTPMSPVYQVLRMPDQNNPRFVLTTLFTPANKDNLNGWLVADNGPNHYGDLTLYQFPQSRLIFGPLQAENQIDSNPVISSQLTLWNQQGSHVIRGDLLLVPVGNALLYIEPVYLVADRQNSLPQLVRVIVNFNKQVYIDTSLGGALQDLLQGTSSSGVVSNIPGNPGSGSAGSGGISSGTGASTGGNGNPAGGAGSGTVSSTGKSSTSSAQWVQAANHWFQQYQVDTAKGDFAAAGQDLKQLGQALAQLEQAIPQAKTKAVR